MEHDDRMLGKIEPVTLAYLIDGRKIGVHGIDVR